jgi:hypothetical protein
MASLTRPLPRRWRSPATWEATILSFWRERASGTVAEPALGHFYNIHFARLVQNPEDLRSALRILLQVKQFVPQHFLDSRPPYMSREGPQWEPDFVAWMALLEPVLEENNGIKLASTGELASVVDEFRDTLPQLYGRRQWILDRQRYEADRVWRQKRRHFEDVYRQEVVAGAMNPRRVEHMMNVAEAVCPGSGIDAVMHVFACDY